ncbi:ChrR family anti-sigma-E factor [Neptuniibacter marinus]|uniref:ChrR family anti-sigma-E factor n=1 Tax=Neptuniibacter marinus TaxID=1806670 RepID=UPI000830653D|nr:ChrR family anti-sigma-E factor [Neptuniibacter marinus]
MNIKHHVDEATLVSYAAGSMSQAMALVTACHLSMCPQCRERLAHSEAMGGALLDALPPAKVAEDSLQKLLASIDEESDIEAMLLDRPDINRPHKDYSDKDIPTALGDYIGGSLANVEWKRIVPGVYFHDLPCKSERGGVSRLLRIAPGKAMLPHSHDGNELTLILQGSFSDEIGRFTVGDIADLDSEVEHQPLVDSDVDCICLIATDAPLKFSTLLGKIVQPMTGF